MKITTRNGVIIEIADGETIPTELMSMIMGGLTATATVAPVTMPPPSAPAAIDTTPAFLPLEGLKDMTPTAPRRRGNNPSKCYLSKTESKVMDVLLQHPNGITSEDVAILLGVTRSAASSTLNRIRTLRPHKDGPTDLLVNRIPGHLYRITALGRELTYVIAAQRLAPKRNRDAGWGR